MIETGGCVNIQARCNQ